MKKFIAAASTCMVIGFAMALANADDSMSNTASKDSQTTMSQQPGTLGNSNTTDSTTTTETSKSVSQPASMGGDMSKNMDSSKNIDSSSSSAMNSDRIKTSKTCTDVSGVTYYRGKKGFSHCLDTQKRSERKDQMSGQAGSDVNTSDGKSLDSSKTIDSTTSTKDMPSSTTDSSASGTGN